MADEKSLLTLLKQKEQDIRAACPSWIDPDRFMASAYELWNLIERDDTGKLKRCTNQSLVNCVYESARTGMEFAAQHAYPVAHGEQAVFYPGYRGKMFLKHQAGAVQAFVADIVRENDEFFIERDSNNPETGRLIHRPLLKGDRGQPIGAYALAKLTNGTVDFEYCDAERIKRSQAKSKQPQGLMWKDFWEAGWKKTPVHILANRLPEGVNPEAIKAYRLSQSLELKYEPAESAELTEEEQPRAVEVETHHAMVEMLKKAQVQERPDSPIGEVLGRRLNARCDELGLTHRDKSKLLAKYEVLSFEDLPASRIDNFNADMETMGSGK